MMAFTCMFGGEFRESFHFQKDPCHQRLVPDSKKQRGRKSNALWVIFAVRLRGTPAPGTEMQIIYTNAAELGWTVIKVQHPH